MQSSPVLGLYLSGVNQMALSSVSPSGPTGRIINGKDLERFSQLCVQKEAQQRARLPR